MTAYNQNLEKPLPNSESAERTILGAIIVENELIAQAAESLTPADFYNRSLNRFVFAAMLDLFAANKPIDPIMIAEQIKTQSANLDNFGGLAAITGLTYGLPRFRDINEYIATVKEKSKLRELIQASNNIIVAAIEESDEPTAIMSFAQSSINEVCADAAKSGFSLIGDLAVEICREKDELRKSGVSSTGLQTGFNAIDSVTDGLQKKELFILAARPGMGKSSLLVNICEGVCDRQPAAVVAVFSLEMSKKALASRMLASSAQVNSVKLKRALYNREEWERISNATVKLNDYAIEIDDTPSVSPAQILSKSMMLKAKNSRLDLIVVDFVQKMMPSIRQDSERLKIGSIARELKNLAKTLDVPVLAISSLSRECESRNPPKPKMSDLAESNIIESEADIVAFIYREHYYNQGANPYHAEIIFEKNREGETGTRELKWIGEFTQFSNA